MQESVLLPQPRGATQAEWDAVAPLPRLNARSDSPEARNEPAELVSNPSVLRESRTPLVTNNPEATHFDQNCIALRGLVPHCAQGAPADNPALSNEDRQRYDTTLTSLYYPELSRGLQSPTVHEISLLQEVVVKHGLLRVIRNSAIIIAVSLDDAEFGAVIAGDSAEISCEARLHHGAVGFQLIRRDLANQYRAVKETLGKYESTHGRFSSQQDLQIVTIYAIAAVEFLVRILLIHKIWSYQARQYGAAPFFQKECNSILKTANVQLSELIATNAATSRRSGVEDLLKAVRTVSLFAQSSPFKVLTFEDLRDFARDALQPEQLVGTNGFSTLARVIVINQNLGYLFERLAILKIARIDPLSSRLNHVLAPAITNVKAIVNTANIAERVICTPCNEPTPERESLRQRQVEVLGTLVASVRPVVASQEAESEHEPIRHPLTGKRKRSSNEGGSADTDSESDEEGPDSP